MQNITSNIIKYINFSSTDYALLVKGEWGSGKTYYIKQDSIPAIEKIGFKAIYVSLNGISSINQLEQILLLKFLKFKDNNNTVQKLLEPISALIKKGSGLLTKGLVNIDITKLNLVSLFSTNKTALFFDDLERISPKIGIDEILGYINSNFVEHKNAKVIFIGDLTKVIEPQKLEMIKEKLIGREYYFEYSSEEVFQTVRNKYNTNLPFQSFIEKNKTDIITLIESFKIYNLRTIFFFTHILEQLFPYLNCKKSNISAEVILFAFLISVEFKKGSFNDNEFEKRKDLIDMVNNVFTFDLIEKQAQGNYNPETFSKYFAYTYLKQLRYHYKFFYSIYNLIVFGELVDDLIKRDFSENPEDEYISSVHILRDYYILSEDEVLSNFNKVLEGLEKGIFNVYTHQYVFDTLNSTVSKKLVQTSTDELKSMVFDSLNIAALRNGFDKYSFDAGDIHSAPNPDSKEVFAKIEELHNSYFKSLENDNVQNILTELSKEKADYSKIIHSFVNIKLSDFFTVDDIIDKLKEATNFSTSKFVRFLAEKYRYDGYATIEDKPLIEKLLGEIENEINTGELTDLDIAVLSDCNRILTNIVSEFNKRIPKSNK